MKKIQLGLRSYCVLFSGVIVSSRGVVSENTRSCLMPVLREAQTAAVEM